MPAGFDARLATPFADLGAPASPADEEGSDGADCAKRDHGPFDCDICGRVFSSKHNLRSHREVVHFNIRRFACSVCNKSFARADRLARHCRTQHNLEVRVTRRVEPASAASSARNSPHTEKVDDVTAAMVKASHLDGDAGPDHPRVAPPMARFDAGRAPPTQSGSVCCLICGGVSHSLEQALEHTFTRHVNIATLMHPAPSPAQAAAALAASTSAGRFYAHQQPQAYAAAAAAATPPASASAGLGVATKDPSSGAPSRSSAMGMARAYPQLDPVPHAGVQSYPMALHAQHAGDAMHFPGVARPAAHQLHSAPHMPLRQGPQMVHGPASFLPPGFDESHYRPQAHPQPHPQPHPQRYQQQQHQQHQRGTHPAFIAAAGIPVSSGYRAGMPLA